MRRRYGSEHPQTINVPACWQRFLAPARDATTSATNHCLATHVYYHLLLRILCNTMKPVWNNTLCKDHPVWKDHFPDLENFYLPLDPVQTEPVWKDHLSGKTTFSWYQGWSFQTGFPVVWKFPGLFHVPPMSLCIWISEIPCFKSDAEVWQLWPKYLMPRPKTVIHFSNF